MKNNCFNCDESGTRLHGYIVCDSCKKDLRLITDKTIEKYIVKFTKPAYKQEMEKRLNILENDFVKKKIKLLDVLSKLK